MDDRLIIAFVASAVVGCGGSVSDSTTDGGIDSAVVHFDTSVIDPIDSSPPAFDSARDTTPTPIDSALPPKDAGKDTTPPPPLVCDRLPLDSTFACIAPTAAQKGGPPSTVCTESALQAFATACISADYKVGSGCDTWKTANAACATCIGNWALDLSIIPGKVYGDRDKCFYQLLDAACSTSFNCMFACDDAVCSDCDRTAGSSIDGKTSEYQACVNRERKKGGTTVTKGACYDLATAAALKCLSDGSPLIDPCSISELFSPTGTGGHPDVTRLQEESVVFFRGACRDGGDWTKSSSSTP